MKRFFTTIVATLFIANLFGQTSSDAIDFSRVMYQGTAKSMGMASAMGAIGGDQTSICINPAGMGLYRSNELNMSLGLLLNNSQSSYYNNNATSNRFRINIPNFGFVSTREKSNYGFVRFTQFGISFNRTNDYNIFANARGLNPTSSMIDSYLGQIDGYSPSDIERDYPFTIFPAWQTYLIDTVDGYYTSPVPQGNLWQNQEYDFKGRSEEWTFSFSANCMDRLFLGASIGLTHLKRFGTRTFKEEVPAGYHENEFRDWTFTENLSTSGIGANLKLGFIYHATTWLRFGASFHSPTLYSLDETWQTETENHTTLDHPKYLSPSSAYTYNLFTPLKWIGSVAFVGHQCMINLDAEYTNFGSSKFKCTEKDYYDYSYTNREIADLYARTLNFRLGAEFMLRSSYLRFGAAYYGSPEGFGKKNGSLKKASIGLSVAASESVLFDFAYELTHGVNEYYLYDAGELGIQPITQKQFRNVFVTSMRIKF